MIDYETAGRAFACVYACVAGALFLLADYHWRRHLSRNLSRARNVGRALIEEVRKAPVDLPLGTMFGTPPQYQQQPPPPPPPQYQRDGYFWVVKPFDCMHPAIPFQSPFMQGGAE